MSVETVIWFPFWYEMDQSISAGQVSDFDFFKEPPHYILHEGRRVFYHGDWRKQSKPLYETEVKRILNIRHPKLGSIQSIDPKGLEYTFTMSDDRILKVEAEETPGVIYEIEDGRVFAKLEKQIDDWRVFVELESA